MTRVTFQSISDAVATQALEPLGVVNEDGTSLVLLGPREPGFWAHVQGTPEFQDDGPDPIDRWSQRVIDGLADQLGAEALYPFGGPPHQPFIGWARATGRIWQSPVSLLIHDRQGLMVSFRGALRFDTVITDDTAPERPCDSCADKPCLAACPVDALSEGGYDVAACKAHATSLRGTPCRTGGCLVRRACPVSQTYDRQPDQSAHHMEYFL